MEVVQLLQSNAKEKIVLSCYLTAINVRVNMQTLAIPCTKTTKLEQNSETYQPTVTITSQTLPHSQTLSPHNSLMLWFSQIARKNLAQKFQGFRMIWTLALNATKSYLKIDEKVDDILEENQILTWYVKFSTLFLKTSDQSLKIQIFKQKTKLLEHINTQLSTLGYQQKITDLRIK